MQGWIKLHRQIADNVLWQDKPFSRGQAWTDLLIMANYADSQMLTKGTVVEVRRGQVFRTQGFLSNRWGWSIKKVRNFMSFLENQKMATAEGIAQGTLITIENFELYQDEGQPEGIKEDRSEGKHRAGQDRQKENNKKEKKFVPPTLEEVRTYCRDRKNNVDPETYMAYYQSNGWMVGRNKMKDWKAAVRTWERKNNEVQSEPRRKF